MQNRFSTSCCGRVVKALDLKSNGVSPRRFKSCRQRTFFLWCRCNFFLVRQKSRPKVQEHWNVQTLNFQSLFHAHCRLLWDSIDVAFYCGFYQVIRKKGGWRISTTSELNRAPLIPAQKSIIQRLLVVSFLWLLVQTILMMEQKKIEKTNRGPAKTF